MEGGRREGWRRRAGEDGGGMGTRMDWLLGYFGNTIFGQELPRAQRLQPLQVLQPVAFALGLVRLQRFTGDVQRAAVRRLEKSVITFFDPTKSITIMPCDGLKWGRLNCIAYCIIKGASGTPNTSHITWQRRQGREDIDY